MRWCNAVIFSFFLAAGAAAQDYPARPVTIVVPQAAGGANDILGRIVA
jgi:tripartite-type tricarboxylate transporter receptor subunit TctC